MSNIEMGELDLDDDDALWDEAFRKSKDILIAMAKKAIADRKAGLTKKIDLDTDFDEPIEA